MNKFLFALIALILLTVAGGVYTWNNLELLVQQAIRSHGSELLTAELNVAEVRIDRQRGRGSIAGIKIANPTGFSENSIIQLGKITFRINSEKTGLHPIIIDEIVIRGSDAVYEINSAGTSNVDTLKQRINKLRKNSSAKEKSPLKVVIRKLIVETSMARLRTPAMGERSRRIRLPKVMMHHLGNSNGGITAGELMQQLTLRILGNMSHAVATTGEQMPGETAASQR